MSIDERRHKTQKKIDKRLKMSKSSWGADGIEHEQPHRLHKWNLTCGCPPCRENKGVRELRKKKLEQIQE